MLIKFEYPTVFLAVVLTAFVITILFGKRKGRLVLVYPSVMIALLFLYPGTARLIKGMRPEIEAGYYHSLWLIPMVLITSYGAASLAGYVKARWAKLLVVLLFCLAILVTGSLKLMQSLRPQLPLNGKDQELVDLAEQIQGERVRESVLIGFDEAKSRSLVCAVDADFRGTLLSDQENTVSENAADLDFYLVSEHGSAAGYAKESGMKEIKRTENYILYQVN